eukprot:70058-Amphidinium_carterae.1
MGGQDVDLDLRFKMLSGSNRRFSSFRSDSQTCRGQSGLLLASDWRIMRWINVEVMMQRRQTGFIGNTEMR